MQSSYRSISLPTMFDVPPSASPSPHIRPETLELAKQGNARAIAAVINQSLKPLGVSARASFKQGWLWVVLEGNSVPQQFEMVPIVQSSLIRLNIPALEVVRVYGRQAGKTAPSWTHDLVFRRSGISPLKVAPSDTHPADSQTATQTAADATQVSPAPSEPTPPKPAKSFDQRLLELIALNRMAEMAAPPSTQPRVQVTVAAPTVGYPVASQKRLMALLKVFTAVTMLVASGSLWQVFQQFGIASHPGYPVQRVLISTVTLAMAIVALIVLVCRNGTTLHPKHAQLAYVRLGIAFLVNVACALVLMILVNAGLIQPQPMLILPLFGGCIMFWVMGCCSLAKAKGYHPLWGMAGILLLDGAVLLSLFPNRRTA